MNIYELLCNKLGIFEHFNLTRIRSPFPSCFDYAYNSIYGHGLGEPYYRKDFKQMGISNDILLCRVEFDS